MAKEKVEKDAKVLSKAERIEVLRKSLEKDFGEGTMIGAKNKPKHYDVISTGSIGLDKALGIGGYPRGRIVELLSWESGGKTTTCLEAIASEHRNDPNSYCGFVDVEHSLDTTYAQSIGVDLNRLEISQPSYGEQALEIAERMCKTKVFSIVVIDSIAALVPKAETEREYGESSMGKQALMMSQAMRKLTPIVAETNVLLLAVNQKREKIGGYGNPETTPGGNALKFYASIRIDITRSTTEANSMIEGEERVGNLHKAKIIKNKVAPPFKTCEFYIRYGVGFDKIDEIIESAIELDIIKKGGSWFSYGSDKLSQGRENLHKLLSDNDELLQEIKQKVLDAWVVKEIPKEEIEELKEEIIEKIEE